jgi:PIN domain nuclease of toxin-antitoxin system
VKLLLDAHALIWAVDDRTQLSPWAASAVEDSANDLLLSAATIWELAIKVGLGKLVLSLPYRQWMHQAMADLGVSLLPITVEYADLQARLPWHHRDSFDRLMIAQAIAEQVPIVSRDPVFDAYAVTRLW